MGGCAWGEQGSGALDMNDLWLQQSPPQQVPTNLWQGLNPEGTGEHRKCLSPSLGNDTQWIPSGQSVILPA
jgi:hypothetical protein